MKKLLSVLMALTLMAFVGCSNAPRDEIVVAQRDASSGTRDAFESIFDCKNAVTGKLIYSSTGTLKTAVTSDTMAIGYISLGSVDESVRALKVDGVVASEENILNKTYKANRPFMIISKKGGQLSEVTSDFLKFIYSTDGQNIVHGAKLIKAQAEDGAQNIAYDTQKTFGTATDKAQIKISGSTSMKEVIDALIEKYNEKQPNVTFTATFMGSGVGKTDTERGAVDIGLISSALGEADGVKFEGHKIATDGIAVVVNKENSIEGLTRQQITKIFKGEIKNWSEIK